jgi:26S proteasome regulatory subunit N11
LEDKVDTVMGNNIVMALGTMIDSVSFWFIHSTVVVG